VIKVPHTAPYPPDPGAAPKPGRGGRVIGTCAVVAAIVTVSCLLLVPGHTNGQPGTLALGAQARQRAHAAYVTFSKAAGSSAAETRACKAARNRLLCLKRADGQLAAAFTHLAKAIGSIPMPSSAKYASTDLARAANQADYSLQRLQAARTLPQYRELWSTWPFILDGIQVGNDYGYLQHLSASAASVKGAGTSRLMSLSITRMVLDGDNIGHDKTIYYALQKLTQRCMAKKGLPYRIGAWLAAPPQSDAPLYIHLAALRRNGFGLYNVVSQQGTRAAAPADPNAAYLKSLTSAQTQRWNDALTSGPQLSVTIADGRQITYQPGGCAAEPYGKIYGSYGKWLAEQDYANDLENKVRTEATWSSRWTSAQARWAHCMASHGFRYPTEAGALYATNLRYQTPGVSLNSAHRFELRVARQDAACADRLGQNQAGRAAIQEAAASLPSDQVSALLTWQELQARAYTAATGLSSAK